MGFQQKRWMSATNSWGFPWISIVALAPSNGPPKHLAKLRVPWPMTGNLEVTESMVKHNAMSGNTASNRDISKTMHHDKLRHEMVSQTNTNKHSTIHPRCFRPGPTSSSAIAIKNTSVIGDHHLISSRFNGHCGWTSVWIYLTPPRRLRNKCGTVSPLTFLLLFFSIYCRKKINMTTYGYGSIPINTIFRGMNIHLPAILMFTRGTRFWHTAI